MNPRRRRQRRRVAATLSATVALVAVLTCTTVLHAVEIQGALTGALDQPRINAIIRPGSTTADPLDAELGELLGGGVTYTFDAFYDTGASNSLIGDGYAEAFGVPTQTGATFSDVGVGGTATFNISEELVIQLAPFGGDADLDNPATFNQTYDQVFTGQHVAVEPIPTDSSGDNIDDIIQDVQDFNVFGMTLMQDKVVVMNGENLNEFVNTGGFSGEDNFDATPFVETSVHDASTASSNPDIPTPDVEIQTSYANFERFTQFSPDTATPPNLIHNPFIGPNPITEQLGSGSENNVEGEASTPGVQVTFNGKSNTGSWLFDTGAAVTLMGHHVASDLGVRYKPGTEPGNASGADPVLQREFVAGTWVDLGDANQFELTIGGVGGQVKIAGFYADSMTVPTKAGDPNDYNDFQHLRFEGIPGSVIPGVPILVHDIGVEDPDTGEQVILDGIFGVNNLFASALLDEPFSLADLANLTMAPSAFKSVTFNEQTGVVGLQWTDEFAALIPEPATAPLLLAGAGLLMMRRRRTPLAA